MYWIFWGVETPRSASATWRQNSTLQIVQRIPGSQCASHVKDAIPRTCASPTSRRNPAAHSGSDRRTEPRDDSDNDSQHSSCASDADSANPNDRCRHHSQQTPPHALRAEAVRQGVAKVIGICRTNVAVSLPRDGAMRAILSMIGVRSLLLCLAGARQLRSCDRCQALLAHPSATEFVWRIDVGHVFNVPNQRAFEHVENVLHETIVITKDWPLPSLNRVNVPQRDAIA